MSLNGLAGAGKAKTDILASKGIHEEPYHGEMNVFGGLFGKKKNKAGTRTVIPIKPAQACTEEAKGPGATATKTEKGEEGVQAKGRSNDSTRIPSKIMY
jgi:hypothetical protein